MDLDFVRIECEVVSDFCSSLSAALHQESWSFESYFRTSVCLEQRLSCDSCFAHPECSYRKVFSQTLSSDPEIVKYHQKPSLPFAIYINELSVLSSSCTIGITVVGSAINYVDQFHKTLYKVIESAADRVNSPVEVVRSFSLDYNGRRNYIDAGLSLSESLILLSGRHIMQNTLHSDSFRLVMRSPLRLTLNGAVARCFDAAVFFRSQLRRCSSLCAYYGSGRSDLDFVAISLAASNISVLENDMQYGRVRWSKQLNRGGLSGFAECSGLVEPMFSLLRLGSFFNAGKGAAFGSGFHDVEVL